MKNLWRVLLGFVLLMLIVIFSVLNTIDIPISFGFKTIQSPLILVIVGAAVCGGVIVLLTTSTTILRKNHKIKLLDKEIAGYQKQLQVKVNGEVESKTASIENELTKQKEHYEEVLADQQQELINLRAELNDAKPAN